MDLDSCPIAAMGVCGLRLVNPCIPERHLPPTYGRRESMAAHKRQAHTCIVHRLLHRMSNLTPVPMLPCLAVGADGDS